MNWLLFWSTGCRGPSAAASAASVDDDIPEAGCCLCPRLLCVRETEVAAAGDLVCLFETELS